MNGRGIWEAANERLSFLRAGSPTTASPIITSCPSPSHTSCTLSFNSFKAVLTTPAPPLLPSRVKALGTEASPPEPTPGTLRKQPCPRGAGGKLPDQRPPRCVCGSRRQADTPGVLISLGPALSAATSPDLVFPETPSPTDSFILPPLGHLSAHRSAHTQQALLHEPVVGVEANVHRAVIPSHAHKRRLSQQQKIPSVGGDVECWDLVDSVGM